MSESPGLAGLISALLVAYTIEFDNEFERHMPHVTTMFGPGGPEPGVTSSGKPFGRTWLASQAMWSNGLRYIGRGGVLLADLSALPTIFKGMRRWGYVVARPGPGSGEDPGSEPGQDWLVRPTRNGIRAQAIWSRLDGVVDRRWESRFGADAVGALRRSVAAVVGAAAGTMPLYLPVMGYADGMRVNYAPPARPLRPVFEPPDGDLSVLLSRALLAFALDFERESRLSLAIGANTLRVLDADGVRLADLPGLTGTSKEGVAASVGFLGRHGCVTVGADPSGRRGKSVRLTTRGAAAQAKHRRISAAVEDDWRERFGAAAVGGLRAALGVLADHRTDGRPTLALGLEPPAGAWRSRPPYLAQTRARLADPWAALPRYPLVLHRGGFPDGA